MTFVLVTFGDRARFLFSFGKDLRGPFDLDEFFFYKDLVRRMIFEDSECLSL